MVLLGMAGQAGAGKDSVSDWLVANCGFEKFSFADALYVEVAEAYGLRHEDGSLDFSLLLDRETKDTPTTRMSLTMLSPDELFVSIASRKLGEDSYAVACAANPGALIDYTYPLDARIIAPLSPRWVMQTWGTEYRRAQDKNYWVKKAARWLRGRRQAYPFPEQAPQYFVNTSARFPNEAQWIYDMGGSLWHIHRETGTVASSHVSAEPLPLGPLDREIYNNDTLERLYAALPMMLKTHIRRLRISPMQARP